MWNDILMDKEMSLNAWRNGATNFAAWPECYLGNHFSFLTHSSVIELITEHVGTNASKYGSTI